MKNFRLLQADEIECRVSQVQSYEVTLLLYKDARCDMNILDDSVGMMNWKKEYSRDNRNCTVSIWDDVKEQWVGKEDTGTESNTESEKGLASDSFKRACFNWGIGRELYSAPRIKIPAAKCNIKAKGSGYACYDRFNVVSIGYDEMERINALTIVNEKTGEIAYQLGQPEPVRTEPKPTNGIGRVKAAALLKHLNAEGIDPDKVLQAYKVDCLEALSENQHRNIIDNTEKLKAWNPKQS